MIRWRCLAVAFLSLSTIASCADQSAFFAVLAGGGVRGGQVVGSSDDRGEQVKDRAVNSADLHASIFHAFGLDPTKPHPTPDGRLVKLTDNGQIVRELFTG